MTTAVKLEKFRREFKKIQEITIVHKRSTFHHFLVVLMTMHYINQRYLLTDTRST